MRFLMLLCLVGCGGLPDPELPDAGTVFDGGAVPPAPDHLAQSARDLQFAIDALPECPVGWPSEPVTIAQSICTLKRCTAACCNQCSWLANTNDSNVRSLFHPPESAFDCEIADWNHVLAEYTFSFAATPPCRVHR
jgi:hypothetical protein